MPATVSLRAVREDNWWLRNITALYTVATGGTLVVFLVVWAALGLLPGIAAAGGFLILLARAATRRD